MKRHFNKILLMTGAGLVLLGSCKKNESEVTFNGGTPPMLTASVSDSIHLAASDSTMTAVAFSWTNPNYMFSTGVSSLSVTYYLEIDTVGANFSSPHMQTVTFTAATSTSYTVSAFNALLSNGLSLNTGQQHNIQVRIQSFLTPFVLGANAGVYYSDTLSFLATPYVIPPAVTPPSNDSLYIVGAAVAADNWANPMPAASIPSETFKQVSPTEYTITVTLVGGAEYKLISQNGSWNNQWSVSAQDTYPNGGPFVFNGANCIAPTASGTYFIDVNFQTGQFTVTPQ